MNPIVGLASGVVVGTTAVFAGQPALMMVGTALASATSTYFAMVAEQKKQTNALTKSFKATLANSDAETQEMVLVLQQKVQAATETSEKVAKKVQTLQTNSRLLVGAVQKVQQRQQVTCGTLTRQAQRLDTLNTQFQAIQPVKVQKQAIPLPVPQKDRTVAHICIDGNNLSKTAKELGLEIDWQALKNALVELVQEADTFTLKYYTGLHDHLTFGQKAWLARLKNLKYEVMSFPLSQREEGKWKTVGDDMAIGVDLMDAVKSGDLVILVTGDGDFIPLIERLQARQSKITVIGARSNTSRHLQKLLSQDFISLESIGDKIVKLKQLAMA